MEMNSKQNMDNELYESSVSLQSFIVMMLAMAIGLLAAIVVLPIWMPNMAGSLGGDSPKVYWFLSRATSFVSMSILWLSMALGLGMTNRMARLWPGAPAAFAIHEYVSLLGLAFAGFHGLILLGDQYIHFNLFQILIPFSTFDYRPFWVGLGQISFYIWVFVALSFYIRPMIGQKLWRAIHYLSFIMYFFGLLHGIFSGTDTSALWVQKYYWYSGGSLLFLLFHRIVNSLFEKLFTGQTSRKRATN